MPSSQSKWQIQGLRHKGTTGWLWFLIKARRRCVATSFKSRFVATGSDVQDNARARELDRC